MSWGVSHRHGSGSVLLWWQHRPAAVAPIQHLAWEPPYAVGAAQKKKKKKKKKQKKEIPHLSLGMIVSEPASRFS